MKPNYYGVHLDTDMTARIETLRDQIQQREPHRKVHITEILRLLLARGLDSLGEEGKP